MMDFKSEPTSFSAHRRANLEHGVVSQSMDMFHIRQTVSRETFLRGKDMVGVKSCELGILLISHDLAVHRCPAQFLWSLNQVKLEVFRLL